MSLEAHLLKLRFPTPLRYIFSLAAVVGGFAVFQWGVPVYTQAAPLPPKWAFALMLLAPVGVGFLLMTFQKVFVDQESIESRFLGFKKHLDAKSSQVLKELSNGFVLVDGTGKKLFIHRFMLGSDELRSHISSRSN